ncbi:SbcC/MukB-like Walker B domain-containing protein [Niabella sp.]|uniref:ATP-binding protein n=1 Tax=Niabella sp. TaxID=1962976 RepID=UPI002621E9D8|nr:SbcC/MukB-like Walker B domain-containing protein [Niabella sp.]
MQLSVFSTDNEKSGFRLQYMEVFNWGTFDEQIHTIMPGGETSLLTGSNGSGKTTFVDALLTLIVPEKKYRFYNQSSGSEKKGDRTEETYVLGGYGTINTENGVTKALYLRENREEAYSILLANFTNEAMQEVTLFQVRYFNNGDMKRVFGVAHKSLHIEEDFKPFDLGNAWKRRLDQQYNKGSRKQVEWFDAASKYAYRLVDVLGMQSIQALTLFNQTVGIKVLGNLDDFIRTHMLEPRDMESLFQELKKHLATLLDAQRNIEKAEEQIRLLQPVQEHYAGFRNLQARQQEVQKALHTAAAWKGYTQDLLLQQALEEARAGIKELEEKTTAARAGIDALHEEERITRNQIDQNQAGQRLKQLEQELQALQAKRAAAEENLALFTEWCTTLHLEDKTASDEEGYKRVLKEAGHATQRLEKENRLNETDDFDARNQHKKAGEAKQKLEEELNILLHSKSNIPAHLVQVRRQLCAALKLDTTELPFAGELMQVKPEEQDWQPAIEKLLYAFSLRLLVPDQYYKKVTRYLNQTNTGTRLVYYRVLDTLQMIAEDDTVYHKLDFHPEHPLSGWVQQQVIQQFSYTCLEDEKPMERYDKAITLNGLIKNRDRHEKDDRPGSNDAGRYVMGWNNESKKEALIRDRNKLADELSNTAEIIERCRNRAARLQKQFYALNRLQEHSGFALLDVAGIQRNIHKTEEQLKALGKSNNQLQELTAQLEEIVRQRQEVQKNWELAAQAKTTLQNSSAAMEQQREQLQLLLQHITETDKEALLQFQQQHANILAVVTLENMETVYAQFRTQLENETQEVQRLLHKEETHLNRSISQIKNPSPALLQRFPDWYSDVQFLPEEAEHAEEFKEWLDKLTSENLPKYRKDFENFVNDTITYKIGGLNEEMEKWEREINNSVNKLNQSLGGINFNKLPDTYIQLGKRKVQDATVNAFRNALLDALPQAANWQQSSFEDKATHFRQKVQPLIDSLDESETYRARVMDVRNWFEFWADEKYRNTGELKKTYRQMGQLSGGEKAQLTYTILCSAIAYQFGITREGKNSRSLRFIAVDESFSNQDEDKATYLMELCKQLHLQLLVVTPSDKIQIVQDYIAHVHLAQRVNNRHSIMYNMTIKELQKQMKKAS